MHGACGFWGGLSAVLFDWGLSRNHFHGSNGWTCKDLSRSGFVRRSQTDCRSAQGRPCYELSCVDLFYIYNVQAPNTNGRVVILCASRCMHFKILSIITLDIIATAPTQNHSLTCQDNTHAGLLLIQLDEWILANIHMHVCTDG